MTINPVPTGHPNHPGDISYRTAGFISGELLKRAQHLLIISRLGASKPIPKNSTLTMKFRGYNPLPDHPKVLMEGITPDASRIDYRDVICQLMQYGDWVGLTDIMQDTHEDPLIPEFTAILGEQSGTMLERIVIEKLMGGTNVFYSGMTGITEATSRNEVNLPLSLGLQRRIRHLKRQRAQKLTSVITPSPNFNTTPIPSSYIAVTHTDCEADIRDMPGFVPIEKYSAFKPMEGEVGSVEGLRYLATTVLEPFEGAGAPSQAGKPVLESNGACADVYPVFVFGKDAFAVTPFARGKAGASPVSPMVLNPNIPCGGDQLGQRGSIGWKAIHGAVILYDMWMCRVEVAVSKL
jgi:N4-gp56 family major capsid protein